MLFDLSIRGIDTSQIKYDNQSRKTLKPEQSKAMDLALEEAKKRKARDYGRTTNDKN